jgi:hypothetical protein
MTFYNRGSSTVYDVKKQEYQLQTSVPSSVKREGSFEVTDFEVPKLAQLDKVLCKLLQQCSLKENACLGF